MYSNCIFCEAPLGTNDVLEQFPVGRRVAFDASKGRLWVVCRRCERWNLSPLEERWEPVEACARLFAGTRLRISSENIGLARHPEGLELVRIGRPLRPELAAWRYGDQFGRRRKKAIVRGAAVGGLGFAAVSAYVAGVIGVAIATDLVVTWLRTGRTRVKIPMAHGSVIELDETSMDCARFQSGSEGWELSIPQVQRTSSTSALHGSALHGKEAQRALGMFLSRLKLAGASRGAGDALTFRGKEAQRVAGLVLTRINRAGASRRTVRRAVEMIEAYAHADAFLNDTLGKLSTGDPYNPAGSLSNMPAVGRLALEMALHEERERRALEGELKGLEIIWRREEEIAAISDDLFFAEPERLKRP